MQREAPVKRPPSSPTLEDVAQAAGVSTATVSRCLNTPDRVVKSTRDRVMAVVREMGYAPNFGARALAAKRTNIIGAIIPTMENAIFARGLQAFQEELARHGFTLLVASSSYKPDLEDEQIRTLLGRGADALLLIGFDRPEPVYRFLRQRGVPVVICWAYREDGAYPSVGFDNIAAMTELARRVIGLGHRRIGVISAPQAHNDRARDRVTAIRSAGRESGLGDSDITVVESPYSVENGAGAMRELMALPDRPTAVMCGNDVLAVGALAAAREMGLSVPGNVSVTGFDDIELARIVVPALTTVHVPHREMGRKAAELLAGALSGGGPAANELLGTHIVERESLGPPAAR